jgi:hypothetical protein
VINDILERFYAGFAGKYQRVWLCLLCAGFTSLQAVDKSQADFIVAPNTAATVEGNSNNVNAFDINGDPNIPSNSQRYQQIYNATLFSGVPIGGAYITQIYFRPDGPYGHPSSATLPDIRIDLSTSARSTEASFNRFFQNNVGADDKIVYGGSTGSPLQLSTSAIGPSGGPYNFDIVINLTTPFLYDPANGSLLLDVRDYEGASTYLSVFDAVNTAGDGIASLFTNGGGVNAFSADITDTTGFVTGFTFISVPEPSCFWIFFAVTGWFLIKRTSASVHARGID